MTLPLLEEFEGPELDARLQWQTPPSRWELDSQAACLRIWSDEKTDFWQRTHYGFRADNGHFLHASVGGRVVLQTRLRMLPKHQYDQAGLMVWISPSCWLKASVEYEPVGNNQLGAVVTNSGFSDWSTQPVDRAVDDFWFRVRLDGNVVIVHCSVDGQDWNQLRMATLLERVEGESVSCGLYACSPKSAGFCVEFDHLYVQPALQV